MTDRELLQQALDALKADKDHASYESGVLSTCAAIEERLAQPEQIDEQGRSMTYWGGLSIKNDYERGFIDGMAKQTQSSVDKALNQKKEWVGLMDDERVAILWDTDTNIDYAKAIEAKLKEKNAA